MRVINGKLTFVFSKGGDETYYAQRSSVDFVAELGREIEQAGVLCCTSDESYDEVVGDGVRAMGAGWTDRSSIALVLSMIEQFQPTHLVLTTPHKRHAELGPATRHTCAAAVC